MNKTVEKEVLIKTYVWSVVTYGRETWVVNKTEEKTLEAIETYGNEG